MPLTRCPASSPVLGSFGPSMDLASELLHGGHRKPVLAYLDSCAKFWQPETIAAWKAEIEAGKTPKFDNPRFR